MQVYLKINTDVELPPGFFHVEVMVDLGLAIGLLEDVYLQGVGRIDIFPLCAELKFSRLFAYVETMACQQPAMVAVLPVGCFGLDDGVLCELVASLLFEISVVV